MKFQVACNFKTDLVGLHNSFLAVDWTFLENLIFVDLVFRIFYDELFQIIVPRNKKNRKRIYPHWFSTSFIKEIMLKKKYKKFNRNRAPTTWRLV